MAQHKWHKEIKAWADEHNQNWNDKYVEYLIKPQPKEPQYLYVYLDDNYELSTIPLDNDGWKYIGKIRLETEDGN